MADSFWHPHSDAPGLYAIVDLPVRHGLATAEVVAAMVESSARPRVVQVRAKHLSVQQFEVAVRSVAAVCLRFGVPVIVNDNVDLAVAGVAGVVGVHLGQEDLAGRPAQIIAETRARARAAGLPNFRVGVSTHHLEDVVASRQLDIDYIGFGPVRATSSKQNPDPVTGFELLQRACEAAAVPVVAIGGLSGEMATRARQSGAQYVAMIGALQGVSCAEIRRRVATEVAAVTGC